MDANEEQLVEVINGLVELSDLHGNYLGRITDNATVADINGINIIVVKQNGEVILYDDLGNLDQTICMGAIDAKFTKNGILISTNNGEKVIASDSGLCIKA